MAGWPASELQALPSCSSLTAAPPPWRPPPQVLPNGARRARGLPLSEKLLPGEAWQAAVVRGVVEELGPVLPPEPQVRGQAAGVGRGWQAV